jgi:hypothetical protein
MVVLDHLSILRHSVLFVAAASSESTDGPSALRPCYGQDKNSAEGWQTEFSILYLVGLNFCIHYNLLYNMILKMYEYPQ